MQPQDRYCGKKAEAITGWRAEEVVGHACHEDILKALDYPRHDLRLERLEEELLKYSNAIRLQDDLTVILIEYGA